MEAGFYLLGAILCIYVIAQELKLRRLKKIIEDQDEELFSLKENKKASIFLIDRLKRLGIEGERKALLDEKASLTANLSATHIKFLKTRVPNARLIEKMKVLEEDLKIVSKALQMMN